MNILNISSELKDKTGKPFAGRLHSLDALRGFDMFWILGVEDVFHGLAENTGAGVWKTLDIQFTHASWNGFHFYDLIFPLFLFIAGVSTPYSVTRELEKGRSRRSLLGRAIKRAFILLILGFIISNGIQWLPVHEIRFSSVLGRIGLAYLLACIIYLYSRPAMQMAWLVIILMGYWLLLRLGSAPGFPAADLSPAGNMASYLDRVVLPGKLYNGLYDPEGLTGSIPAIATALIGIFTGDFLRNNKRMPPQKAAVLFAAGMVMIIAGWVWGFYLPVNKNLWTSSFVLQSGGISLLLMAAFYYIIDVRGQYHWALFFRVIGMNAILIYMADQFIDWEYTANGLLEWLIQLLGDRWETVTLALGAILLKWFLLYFLYRRRIFLRV